MKYQLFNETDQLLASQNIFDSEEKAKAYADTLRQRFLAQGYYLTTRGTRIRPEEVKLIVVPT
jgi:hypothetical protein